MYTPDNSQVQNNQTINERNILKSTELDTVNNEVNILHFDRISCNQVLEDLEKFKIENFPKIFAFQLKLSCETELSERDEIKNKIAKKFCDRRPVLLQIFDLKKEFIYYRNRNEDYKVPKRLANLEKLMKKIKENLKFSVGDFIQLQSCPIIKANFDNLRLDFEAVKYLLYAINAQDELCFRLLMLLDCKPDAEILTEVIKSQNFEILLALIKSFNEEEICNSDVENLIKFSHKNIFEIAVENRNVKVVKFLLKYKENFLDFFNIDMIEKSLNFCIKNDIFEVYNEIIKFEFKNTKLKKLVESHREILEDIENLSKSIENGNQDEIQIFILKYKNYRICYNSCGICALEHAINKEKYKIYSFLRGNAFYSDKPHELNSKISKLEENVKILIREENLKYMKKDPNAFIYILAAKCDFDPLSPIKTDEIRKMSMKLSEMFDIRPFLEIAAISNGIFYFDYINESVQVMDSTKSPTTLGVTYESKDMMYIGSDKSEVDHFGTFAHECAHYVFYLIYENNCLPYCDDDEDRKKLWDEIRVLTSGINVQPVELIVYHAYSSYETIELKNKELAVRVCHMVAKYIYQPQKLNELEIKFEKLFMYHRKYILPDLMIPNVYRLIKINNEFEVLSKIKNSKLKVKESCRDFDLQDFKTNRIYLRSNVPQLTFSMILNEIKKIQGNKLDLKTKNIFVDLEMLKQDYLRKELDELLSSSKVEKIIFQAESEENLKLVEKYEIMQLIVANFDVKDSELVKTISHDYKDLTDEAKNELKNKSLKFHENYFNILEFIDNIESISSDTLSIMCKNNEIMINCGPKVEKKEIFIQRFVETKSSKIKFKIFQKHEEEKKDDNSVDLESFIDSVLNNQIVLFSDIAGSGKTTALKRIHRILVERFPTYWVTFVGLRDFVEEFSKGVGNSFIDFIARMLNLNALDKEILIRRFSSGQVKILFDAFDEISPDFKENATKLFRLFNIEENSRSNANSENSQNQIYITTRTHLEESLEQQFRVFPYKLRIFSEPEQIDFVKKIWKDLPEEKTKLDSCATKLVVKIMQMLVESSDVIGIPLIVEGLAIYFKNKLDKNFDKEVEDLSIFRVFKNIVFEASLNILHHRFPDTVKEHLHKNESILKVHQYYAFIHLFPKFEYYDYGEESWDDKIIKTISGEDFASHLGLDYDVDEWKLDDIVRGGILYYDKNGKIQFNHQTYAENLLAQIIFNFLKNIKNPTIYHVDLFMQVMRRSRFRITKVFLEDMLTISDVTKFKIFDSEMMINIYQALRNERRRFNLISSLAYEGNSELFRFILRFTKCSEPSIYKEYLELQEKSFGFLILMIVFQHMRSERKFRLLLDEIFEFYGDEIDEKFFFRLDFNEGSIFDFLIVNSFEKFELFLKIIEEKNYKLFEIKNRIFEHRSKGFGTFLNQCLRHFQYFREAIKFIIQNASKKQQKEIILAYDPGYNKNILLHACQLSADDFEYVFSFIINVLDEEELKSLFFDGSGRNQNILHEVAEKGDSTEVLEKLWEKISMFFDKEQQKSFLRYKNWRSETILELSLWNKYNRNIFISSLKILKQTLSPSELTQLLDFKKLFLQAVTSGAKLSLMYSFGLHFTLKNEEENKIMLDTLKGEQGEELIKFASRNENFNLIEFLWQFLQSKISIEGCERVLIDYYLESKDFWAQKLMNFLNSIGFLNKLKEVFDKEFKDLKNEDLTLLEERKEPFKLLLKQKDHNNKHLLHHLAEQNIESQITKFVLAVILNTFSAKIVFLEGTMKNVLNDIEDFLIEFDNSNLTPFHYALKYCSIQNLVPFLEFYEPYFSHEFRIKNSIKRFKVFFENADEEFLKFFDEIPQENFEAFIDCMCKGKEMRYKFLCNILKIEAKNGKSLFNYFMENPLIKDYFVQSMEKYYKKEVIEKDFDFEKGTIRKENASEL